MQIADSMRPSKALAASGRILIQLKSAQRHLNHAGHAKALV